MIYYFVLGIGAFFAFIVLIWKRSVFHNIAEGSIALVNVLLGDSEDEDALIKLIQSKTNLLLLNLFKMFLVIVAALFIGSIPVLLYLLITTNKLSNLDLTSIYSIIAISVGASLPFVFPFSKKPDDGYSELSKLLHRMILDNYNVAKKLFFIETKAKTKRGLKTRNDFVVISGLARAGTTSLMTDLSSIDSFVSLSYANMPFLTSPNLWSRLYKPKQRKLKERSHKDGIMIGYNSTEALEEYFFKMLANDSYIHEDYIEEYDISKSENENYLKYQRNIKSDNSKIYLAKNNNFLVRYNSIRSYNNEFLLYILYRDPLTHAASLMEKHLDYVKLQSDDDFVLEYMDWLGHHEFGLHQKQFLFNDSKELLEGDRNKLDYWLKIWINYYSHALKIDHENTFFVDYLDYCSNPSQIVSNILDRSGVKADIPQLKPFKNKRKTNFEYSSELLERAEKLYIKLQTKNN
jgi:hypothetical protein